MRTRMRFRSAALALVAVLAIQTWAQTEPNSPVPPTPTTQPATRLAQPPTPLAPPATLPAARRTPSGTSNGAQPPSIQQPATRAAQPPSAPVRAPGQPATPTTGQPAARKPGTTRTPGESPTETKPAAVSAKTHEPPANKHELSSEKPAEPAEAAPAGLDFMSMVFVFMLATFIGIGVIRRVSRLLHTPLMSLTNAISAIAVVGSIMLAGGKEYPNNWYHFWGAVALFASTTNIVSGFLITDRMLKMFKTREVAK